MSALSRFNRSVDSSLGLDLAFRTISYGCLLYAQFLKAVGEPNSKKALFLVEVFDRLSEARFINRLFGLPAMWEWFKSIDGRKDFVQKLMALSMVLYYPLEHAWWFSQFKTSINNFISFDGTQASLWSLRCWLVFVVLDVYRNVSSLKKNTTKTESLLTKLKLQANACDFVLALQYSVVNGPFSDTTVTLAGFFGGLLGMYIRVKDWAKLTEQEKSDNEKKKQ